ncbi:MAG: glycosyltransferase [Solirubrobacteraceae bacterium]
MSPTVCLVANTLAYPSGGGHRWAYLNWALGLRAAGSEVLWLETVQPDMEDDERRRCEEALRLDLKRHGLVDSLLLYDERGERLSNELLEVLDRPLDVLLTLNYYVPPPLRTVARRTVLLDLDPGLTQLWIRAGYLQVSGYDMYFSIAAGARRQGGLPDCGIEWRGTSPCVHVAAWPLANAEPGAPYTTVSHWWTATESEGYIEFDGEWVENSKRAGFEPFLTLPGQASVPLELALGGLDSPEEERRLRSLGWRVRDAATVTSTTASYASYIRDSRGEFSCCKPSVTRLRSGWVSDRTLCYLASGKPCVVQYSGELGLAQDACGLLQFRTQQDAAQALLEVESDYARYSRGARALAEGRFDAARVAGALLEEVL